MTASRVDLAELPLPGKRPSQRDWERLYVALRPIVLSELLRTLPWPYVGAEDIWHELFLRFVEDPQILRRVLPESREAYVRVAARHRAFDYRRRERVRAEAGEGSAALPEVPSVVLDPSVRIDAEKLLSFVNEPDRSMLRMRYLEGLALGEIARRTGETYSNVAVRIFRALAKLRESQAKL